MVKVHSQTAVEVCDSGIKVCDLNDEVTGLDILPGRGNILPTGWNIQAGWKPLLLGETVIFRGVGTGCLGAEMREVGDFDIQVGEFDGRADGRIVAENFSNIGAGR